MGEALRHDDTGIDVPRSVVRPGRGRRRVFIRDARGNGHYLRATWHPEGRMFVVSTWRDELCTGAVRLPVEASGDLAALLIDGMAESLVHPAEPVPRPGLLDRLEGQLRVWSRRARAVAAEARPRRPRR